LYWHIRKIVISHDDTDDVIQNTFLKVLGRLESFREDSQLLRGLPDSYQRSPYLFKKKEDEVSLASC
jgi:hypothetical protein